jgi:uncharacterized protein YkwD
MRSTHRATAVVLLIVAAATALVGVVTPKATSVDEAPAAAIEPSQLVEAVTVFSHDSQLPDAGAPGSVEQLNPLTSIATPTTEPAPALLSTALAPPRPTATQEEPSETPTATERPRTAAATRTPTPTRTATRTPTMTRTPAPSPTPTFVPVTLTASERWMFDEHNELRAADGAEPLILDPRLVRIARARAEDMARRDYFSHYPSNGDSAWNLLADAGINYDGAGENIVANEVRDAQPSVSKAMDDLMDSPGHRNNILRNRWVRVGIGAVYDEEDEKWYYSAIYVSP